jgi:hypothetical protein
MSGGNTYWYTYVSYETWVESERPPSFGAGSFRAVVVQTEGLEGVVFWATSDQFVIAPLASGPTRKLFPQSFG